MVPHSTLFANLKSADFLDLKILVMPTLNFFLHSCSRENGTPFIKFDDSILDRKLFATFLLGKTCSEIKSFSPEASSGSYVIDPDGEGGCEPIVALCNMNYGIGVTVISHNSEERTLVNGFVQGAYRKKIDYSGVNSSCISQLVSLTAVSSHCEQFIKYECLHSRLLFNGNSFGWWVSRDGVKMKYWGGAGPADSYKCACGVTQQCANPSNGCNCDKNDMVWREDSGFLREKSHLPVIELRFGDTEGSNEKGYHSLGKLVCYGNN